MDRETNNDDYITSLAEAITDDCASTLTAYQCSFS